MCARRSSRPRSFCAICRSTGRLPRRRGASARAAPFSIPARNEEANIADALRSVLRSDGVDLEVIVLDDGSTDRTAEIVREFARADPRVRLETAPPLPPGWCGKNHACQQLAGLARHPLLVFMDADVRVSTRTRSRGWRASWTERRRAGQRRAARGDARTFMEQLIIPLIHFVLLGFLPIERMRAGTDPRFAAACGQILAVRRDAYEAAAATRRSRTHPRCAGPDPRLRARGFRTDLFDATGSFRCRMYRGAREVWQGFAKNAHEGLASPRLILPSTLLLLGGQVLPLRWCWPRPHPSHSLPSRRRSFRG